MSLEITQLIHMLAARPHKLSSFSHPSPRSSLAVPTPPPLPFLSFLPPSPSPPPLLFLFSLPFLSPFLSSPSPSLYSYALKVETVHLNAKTSAVYKVLKSRGVEQRNTGLSWIREHCKTRDKPACKRGVLYFMDDDNKYDIRIFEEVYTQLNTVQEK